MESEVPELVSILKEEIPTKPVPLVLLTGFLGSGKSTLVRHAMSILSAEANPKRVALIQNEFSQVEDKNPLVSDSEGNVFADFLDLANGCVCCTVKTDFVSAIQELLKRRRFDLILVECRGDADPSPIIELFWVDQELDFGVYLDSVVCVVDSLNFQVFRNSNQIKGVRNYHFTFTFSLFSTILLIELVRQTNWICRCGAAQQN